ncbi:MAG: T9SS type A sorting domain-containing protein [Bacteroidia bacterium]|nr:T9SS type A sorting domain-containing protein [Bacteroidia bacterium]
MNKTILSLFGIGLAGFVSAQTTTAYFQKYHLLTRTDVLTATGQLGFSQFMLGTGFDITLNTNVVDLIRSDAAGTIVQTPNSFAASYEMKLATVFMPVQTRGVVAPGATSTTPTHVVTAAGDYMTSQGCFVLTTNLDGSVRSGKHITPAITANEFRVKVVTGAASTINNQFVTNQVYVIGYIDITNAAGEQGVATFVMAMNSVTNTVLWFKIYNLNSFANTNAEREEPVAACINNNQLVIAGNATTTSLPSPLNQRSFVLRIDQQTGNFVTYPLMIDFERPSQIKGMDQSNVYSNSLQQINLCGTTTDITNPGPGVNDTWVAALNTAVPSTAWSNVYDYSGGGNNAPVSIINTNGFLLVAGNVDQGLAGNDFDMTVMRLVPSSGTPMYEATYGVPGEEYATGIEHQFALTGFRLSGNKLTNTRSQFTTVSAYYNGISGCNEVFAMPVVNPFTLSPVFISGTIINVLHNSQNMNVNIRPLGRTVTECFSTSIPGGSNTRIAAGTPMQEDDNVKVYPNPASTQGEINLQWNAAAEGQARITVYDLSGRMISQEEIRTDAGPMNRQIPLNGMKPGTYLIVINEAGEEKHVRFTLTE